MAEETDWTACGLFEVAIEEAIIKHRIPWAQVRAAALKAIAYVDERSPPLDDAERAAIASYVPNVIFRTQSFAPPAPECERGLQVIAGPTVAPPDLEGQA